MHLTYCIKYITISIISFFFFNDTATTEIYTLSLHDALPICTGPISGERLNIATRVWSSRKRNPAGGRRGMSNGDERSSRSEEHTSELQSLAYLVCRLLLEKKKKKKKQTKQITNTHRTPYHEY